MGYQVLGAAAKSPDQAGRKRNRRILLACLVVAASTMVAGAPPAPRAVQETQLDRVAGQAVRWLSDYVKINTTNPPGRELRAARYLAELLEQEGVYCRIVVSQPGRANLVARIPGRARYGGLALIHHMDVVPVNADGWTVPPFSGLVRDGYVWGRGTLDSKGLGIVHLSAMVALKRSGRIPERDVVLLAVADEETGGRAGMGWVVENRPEWLSGVDYALAEGGMNIVQDNRLAYVGIENMQKVAVWLRLTARGEPGHASYPSKDAAPHRLVRALDRLLRYQPNIVVTPAVSRYFREIAPFQPPDVRDRLLRAEELRRDPDAVRRLDPVHQALLRNTIAVSGVNTGNGANAIPGMASAELDCRLVPTQDPDEFIKTVNTIVNDSNILVEPVMLSSSVSSPLATELFDTIRTVTQSMDKQTMVGSAVLSGFTDSRFLRERGVVAYGFEPFKASNGIHGGIHGSDERLPISDLDFAVRYFSNVVFEFAFSSPRPTGSNGVSLKEQR